MNIQQYYDKAAMISLNASLASLLPPLILLIYSLLFVPPKMVIIWAVPFLIYSIVCFQSYITNSQRAKEAKSVNFSANHVGTLFQKRAVSLTFLPAPSLRMLFFNANGQAIGEIRDTHLHSYRWFLPYFCDRLAREKQYGLFTEDEQPFATYKMRRDSIIIDWEGKSIQLTFKNNRAANHIEFINEINGRSFYVERARLYMDFKIFIESKTEAVILKKGWLPKEWSKHVMDANTPYLTFHKELSLEDQLAVYAILIYHLRKLNH